MIRWTKDKMWRLWWWWALRTGRVKTYDPNKVVITIDGVEITNGLADGGFFKVEP